jgi:hypothetical protein
MAALRDRGLADRTIFSRVSTVLTFLRSFGVEGLLSRRDLPRYTQKSVDAYGVSSRSSFASWRFRGIVLLLLGPQHSDLKDVAFASYGFVENWVDEEAEEEAGQQAGDDYDGERLLSVAADSGRHGSGQ